ncbi:MULTISPECIES: hypothetical protein [unclassified Lysobacter]|jgi:hypothetical protein|uniref:hypothetical protein n=1 Tax=unclassified Lysobacter TaxID=2635362 RepID=UPI001F55AC33|nr:MULTISPECIES: hypothetical protein [unclassified Lysobacter]
MPWLLILLAAAAFAVAFVTTSMALAVVCLLASLILVVAGVMALLAQRLGSRSRDEVAMIDPAELRRLREQADARRNAAQSGGDAPSA